MMSNEQAIAYLMLVQGKYLNRQGEMKGDSINEITALDMAIEALEEKSGAPGKGCDACAGVQSPYLICSVWRKGGTATVSAATYCPICGRKLVGEEAKGR